MSEASLEDLPEELFGEISSFLRWQHVIKTLFLVSKSYQKQFSGDYVWKRIFEIHKLVDLVASDELTYLSKFQKSIIEENKRVQTFFSTNWLKKPWHDEHMISYHSYSRSEIEKCSLKVDKNAGVYENENFLGFGENDSVKCIVNDDPNLPVLDTVFVKMIKTPNEKLCWNKVYFDEEVRFQPIGFDEKRKERFECWQEVKTEDDEKIFNECFSDYENKKEGRTNDFHKMNVIYTIRAPAKEVDELRKAVLALKTKDSKMYFGGRMVRYQVGTMKNRSKLWSSYSSGRDQAIALVSNNRVVVIFMCFARYWG